MSITTVKALRAAHHDALHLRDEGLIRLPDPEIAAKAARSSAPSVIIFRLRNRTPIAVNPRLFRVVNDCAEELGSGAIMIVEDSGYRVRRLPIAF